MALDNNNNNNKYDYKNKKINNRKYSFLIW